MSIRWERWATPTTGHAPCSRCPWCTSRAPSGSTTRPPPTCCRRSCSGSPGSGCSTTCGRDCSTRSGSSIRCGSRAQGIDTGGRACRSAVPELAVFGQMLLQRGQWEGKQIVPAAWIDEATAFQVQNTQENPDWRVGYGYQFWRCQHGAYRGDGAFGQFVVVMPEQDAVFLMNGGLTEMQPCARHPLAIAARVRHRGRGRGAAVGARDPAPRRRAARRRRRVSATTGRSRSSGSRGRP